MTFFAVLGQQTLPVELGQHEIQNHEVVGAGFSQIQTLFAVAGYIYGVAGTLPQRARHIFRQPFFVLDHQYSQVCTYRLPAPALRVKTKTLDISPNSRKAGSSAYSPPCPL